MPVRTLFAVAAVALVGCGGSAKDSSSASSTTTSVAGTGAGAGTGGGAVGTGAGTGSGTGGTSSTCAGGPLDLPIPNCAPAPPPSTGDFGQDCVDRINQFRWECQCLPPLERWTSAESCTDGQSADDQAVNGPHANFAVCGEWAQNTCPDWNSHSQIVDGCLQMMWDEGPGEPFSAHGHYINMSSKDYTKVACGSSSDAGGVWSNQNFQ